MSDSLHSADFLALLSTAQERLDEGFAPLPAFESAAIPAEAAAVLAEAAALMHDNYPYAHPLYAGQMLKPPHPVARAAYALAMSVNPNNHALDGGRASSAMELEAVAAIAAMFGLPEHLGHLTSSGTIANLEALWIAGQLHPGKAVVASSQAHYTHTRISGVLGLEFFPLPVDDSNRVDLAQLELLLQTQAIGTVVATLGTTATGSVDPLDGILLLQKKYGFRIHVDAAYGGYFTLAGNLEPAARAAYDSIAQADSVVIDPHKHGLQPYGCGCVLFRDPAVGRFYKHDSPFTYFTSGALHLGEISLRMLARGRFCGRSVEHAAAAAAGARRRLCERAGAGQRGGVGVLRARSGRRRSLLRPRILRNWISSSTQWLLLLRRKAPRWRRQSSTRRRGAICTWRWARLPVTLFPAGTWPASDATRMCFVCGRC